jgi:hypothetical protein
MFTRVLAITTAVTIVGVPVTGMLVRVGVALAVAVADGDGSGVALGGTVEVGWLDATVA